jgi:DNA end-binding protein Ku
MARAIWSGAISFGLVSVPVKAYTATRDHSVHFNQLDAKGARVRYEKVSERTGKPVEDIKLGYERSKGKYVTFDRDEIEELRPASTKAIDVEDFVDLADIDPIYYQSTYWLGPDGDAAKRAYAVLLAAMEDQQKVGVGTVVMRNKQYLAAIRPLDGALAMSTMRFADEVLPKSKIDGVPSRVTKPKPKELALANQIIDSLSSTWDPKRYHDTYTDVLRDLIERKADGEEIEVERPEEGKATVVDLMAVLQQSVQEARKGRKRTSTRTKKRAAARKAPVKKRAATKKSA